MTLAWSAGVNILMDRKASTASTSFESLTELLQIGYNGAAGVFFNHFLKIGK
jgi:hypothetical protein